MATYSAILQENSKEEKKQKKNAIQSTVLVEKKYLDRNGQKASQIRLLNAISPPTIQSERKTVNVDSVSSMASSSSTSSVGWAKSNNSQSQSRRESVLNANAEEFPSLGGSTRHRRSRHNDVKETITHDLEAFPTLENARHMKAKEKINFTSNLSATINCQTQLSPFAQPYEFKGFGMIAPFDDNLQSLNGYCDEYIDELKYEQWAEQSVDDNVELEQVDFDSTDQNTKLSVQAAEFVPTSTMNKQVAEPDENVDNQPNTTDINGNREKPKCDSIPSASAYNSKNIVLKISEVKDKYPPPPTRTTVGVGMELRPSRHSLFNWRENTKQKGQMSPYKAPIKLLDEIVVKGPPKLSNDDDAALDYKFNRLSDGVGLNNDRAKYSASASTNGTISDNYSDDSLKESIVREFREKVHAAVRNDKNPGNLQGNNYQRVSDKIPPTQHAPLFDKHLGDSLKCSSSSVIEKNIIAQEFREKVKMSLLPDSNTSTNNTNNQRELNPRGHMRSEKQSSQITSWRSQKKPDVTASTNDCTNESLRSDSPVHQAQYDPKTAPMKCSFKPIKSEMHTKESTDESNSPHSELFDDFSSEGETSVESLSKSPERIIHSDYCDSPNFEKNLKPETPNAWPSMSRPNNLHSIWPQTVFPYNFSSTFQPTPAARFPGQFTSNMLSNIVASPPQNMFPCYPPRPPSSPVGHSSWFPWANLNLQCIPPAIPANPWSSSPPLSPTSSHHPLFARIQSAQQIWNQFPPPPPTFSVPPPTFNATFNNVHSIQQCKSQTFASNPLSALEKMRTGNHSNSCCPTGNVPRYILPESQTTNIKPEMETKPKQLLDMPCVINIEDDEDVDSTQNVYSSGTLNIDPNNPPLKEENNKDKIEKNAQKNDELDSSIEFSTSPKPKNDPKNANEGDTWLQKLQQKISLPPGPPPPIPPGAPPSMPPGPPPPIPPRRKDTAMESSLNPYRLCKSGGTNKVPKIASRSILMDSMHSQTTPTFNNAPIENSQRSQQLEASVPPADSNSTPTSRLKSTNPFVDSMISESPTHTPIIMPPRDTLWFYIDPSEQKQGPFTSIEMVEWQQQGYFNEQVLVRRMCDKRFASIEEFSRLTKSSTPFLNDQSLLPLEEDVKNQIEEQEVVVKRKSTNPFIDFMID